jgi:high-affinity nickel-transport protein
MTVSSELLVFVSALLFGLRHGIDWDHIAAIADVTGSQEAPAQSLWLGTVYALGHGLVVAALGLLAVSVGDLLPDWVDATMEHVVGLTLIVLGVYVVYSLVKDRQNFRMRSRWMLIFEGVEIGYRRLMSKITGVDVQTPVRRRNYGFTSAFIVGMIHGVGAETPTQVLLFLSAAGVAGKAVGMALVLTFIIGLLISNSAITLLSTFGFTGARKNTATLVALGGITAVFSLAVGTVFLLGQGGILPAFFGG